MKVKCYLLSDRVLISEMDGDSEKEYLRIKINNDSFITRIKDGIYLKNRLLLCGQKISIHFTFKNS